MEGYVPIAKPTPFAMPQNGGGLQGEQLGEPSSPFGLPVPCRVQASEARPQKLFPRGTPHNPRSCQPTPRPGTSGLVLFHSLLLVVVAEGGLQPLGRGALLEAQHLLRAVPQGPVLCKGQGTRDGRLGGYASGTPPAQPCSQVPPQSPTARPPGGTWGVHGGMAPPCTPGEGIPAPPASSSITVQKMGAEFPPLLLSLSHPSLCPVPKRL